MKFNLKNRPSYLPKDEQSYIDFTMKAEEWFEAFEKELRQLVAQEQVNYLEQKKLEQYTLANFFEGRIHLVWEILGVE